MVRITFKEKLRDKYDIRVYRIFMDVDSEKLQTKVRKAENVYPNGLVIKDFQSTDNGVNFIVKTTFESEDTKFIREFLEKIIKEL